MSKAITVTCNIDMDDYSSDLEAYEAVYDALGDVGCEDIVIEGLDN